MQQVRSGKQADPAPRRPTTVVQFNSRSDRKSFLARWWAGARGGLRALQRLTLNHRPTWRPRDLVPPYKESQRIAEKGEHELDWGGKRSMAITRRVGQAGRRIEANRKAN